MSSGNVVQIVDEDGHVLNSYRAAAGAWLDQTHVMLFAPVSTQDNGGDLYVATVGTDDLAPIGRGSGWIVPNGFGLAAMSTDDGSTVVWDGKKWSEPVHGYPIAWSADGSKLAQLTDLTDEPGTCGYLRVITWPDEALVWSDASEQMPTCSTGLHFDATGRYLAFQSFVVKLLDLKAGDVSSVGPTEPSSWFGWRADGTLTIADRRGGLVAAYSVDGSQGASWRHGGDAAQTSADGSTLILYTQDYAGQNRPPITVIDASGTSKLNVDGTSDYPPNLAPDGHALVMFVDAEQGSSAVLHRIP